MRFMGFSVCSERPPVSAGARESQMKVTACDHAPLRELHIA
ncbi:hypothetical protein LF41_1471 [Lysobacter dokdonensis DS-58]|uniref:Uncharacterized protein n=1 Tax=Lysobacter dokdonensis DS-58 TaxID=1300345 RepID=A0A0A2WHD1_9GAMM|nr:hypothetical protein LF41_1471 [Lysobacter dokdonensis DS-58]